MTAPSANAAATVDTRSDFAQHVASGLRAAQPYLSSRFIYDDRGSRIFQQIMALDEYYLTRTEYGILQKYAGAIVDAFLDGARSLDLIELGAGDGKKTKLLLAELTRRGADFRYRPVDISADILAELGSDLRDQFPRLQFSPLVGTYVEAIAALAPDPTRKQVVLFLGSNLGNFSLTEAGAFTSALTAPLDPGDQLFIGVDLRKNPHQILRAYNDDSGVTAAFNLNLLHRLRDEVGAVLDIHGWSFYPSYDPETGELRSYLCPQGVQRIEIPALGIDRSFAPHEVIHTEISRKYSLEELAVLAKAAGTRPTGSWSDDRRWFVDELWTK